MLSHSTRAVVTLQKMKPTTNDATTQFEHIFSEHYPRVYRALVRLVGDPAEAEDLALETFWRLHHNPPRAQAQNLGGWLYRVATNLGRNALRTQRRRAQYEQKAGAEMLNRAANDDPVETYAAEEERTRVRQTLARMNERGAQLLLMRYSGMAYAELATALGVSPESIGTLLVRAEREFEKKFREQE